MLLVKFSNFVVKVKSENIAFEKSNYVSFIYVQGHEKEALQLMATYLPKDTSPGSAYQEGGGLYALGLIHANHGGEIIDYLLSQLKNASNDVSGKEMP